MQKFNLPGHAETPICWRTGWVVTVPSTSIIISPLARRRLESKVDVDWLFIVLIALKMRINNNITIAVNKVKVWYVWVLWKISVFWSHGYSYNMFNMESFLENAEITIWFLYVKLLLQKYINHYMSKKS